MSSLIYIDPFLAMEWGFKAHERGENLEMAREKFAKIIRGTMK